MEKMLAGIAGLAMAVMGAVFLAAGCISWILLAEEMKVLAYVFLAIGFAFVLMMFLLLRMVRRYQKESSPLLKDGRKVQASIVEVKEVTEISVNGKHPYLLICKAEGRIFESEYFYQDVHRFDGKEFVDVYLDETSDDYQIDLES